VNEIVTALEKIVEMMGPTAAAAWGIALRQVQVRGVWAMIMFGVWLGLAISCKISSGGNLRQARELEASRNYHDSDLDGLMLFYYGLLCVALASGVLALFCLQDFIGYLMNPQYYAIQMLLGMVK
jgi:hypothetical protein